MGKQSSAWIRGRLGATAFSAAVLVAALAGSAGAQESLADFYGSQNIQSVTARYGSMLAPAGGYDGELMFGFDTSSRRTEASNTYKYFYGVALGGGGFAAADADLGSFGRRDFVSGYVLLQLEFKVFASGDGPVRPYLGGSLGYGNGYLWGEHIRGEDDLPKNMSLYTAGVEGGVHLPLKNGYGLIAAAGVDARLSQFGGDTLAAYPAMITVGVCRWKGRMGP